MSLALATHDVMRIPHHLTLHEKLREHGVATISSEVVRSHMHATIASHRTGIYTIIGPVLYGLAYLLYTLSTFAYVGQVFLGLLAVLGILASLSFAGVPYASLFALALGTTFVAFFAWIFVFCDATSVHSSRYNIRLAHASSIWMRDRIYSFSRSDLFAFGVPERLHGRVMRLQAIPDVQVHKLRFGIDPILEVSQRRGPFLERAYIGGWDTGVALIDNA